MNRKTPDVRCRPRLLLLLTAIFLLLTPLRVQAAEFVLLYSNDNHGEIDPCG